MEVNILAFIVITLFIFVPTAFLVIIYIKQSVKMIRIKFDLLATIND